MTATAVLVHGAWHGAWCFDRVVPLLEAAGIPVRAVDLPGHGDDRGPFTDLHGDSARVRSVLDAVEGEAVLLGHSYGGAVITEAGAHPAVSHLVYLCALVLTENETCGRAAVEESAHLSHEGRPSLADGWSMHDDGTTSLSSSQAAACLYNGCDPETVAWAVERLGRQPMANLGQAPAAVAWRHRPSTYVICTDDLAIHPGLQQILARRCTTAVEWGTGHSPFASHPQLVSELLIGLCTG
jgi:pimeloyl-ACP methyl ester carboxylesterase